MKNRQRIRYVTLAALLAIATPSMATTTLDSTLDSHSFFALSSLEGSELTSLTSLSDAEMSTIQGEFFNFGFNFAFLPQINICVFCFGTTQINNGSIFGLNLFP